MTAPTFHLPACPVCSSLVLAERPHWRLARLTTKKTGKPTYILTGCPHADEVGRGKLRDDPAEWALVEEAWAARAEELFAIKTATPPWDEERRASWRKRNPNEIGFPAAADGWTEALRATFRAALGDQTAILTSTPVSPAQPQQQEKKE